LPVGERYDGNGGESPSTPLCELLEALHTIGDQRAVERLGDRLVQAAARIEPDGDLEVRELSDIVRALIHAGRIDAAETIVAAVPASWAQIQIYASMAQTYSFLGDFARAERAVTAIPQPNGDQGATSWIDLMTAALKVGDQPRALRAAESAWDDILRTETDVQPRLVNHLVQMLPRNATRPLAVQAAPARIDPPERDRAYVSALLAHLVTGRRDQVGHLLSRLTDRSSAHGALIDVLAVEDFDESVRRMADLTDPTDRSLASERLAGRLAVAGDVERAQLIADAIEMPTSRSDALIILADLVVAAGDRDRGRALFQEAERVAATIVEPRSRESTWQWLAECLTDVGEFDEVERVLLAEAETFDPVIGLGKLAEAMATAGDAAGARRVVARAEPFAAAYADPTGRAWRHTWLARSLISAGAVDDAARLLLEAVPVEPWYQTVGPVAAVDPDAVRALAEAVLAEGSSDRA